MKAIWKDKDVIKIERDALVRKGILVESKGVSREDGPAYYQWTGMELE
jgi:hypothetical protein